VLGVGNGAPAASTPGTEAALAGTGTDAVGRALALPPGASLAELEGAVRELLAENPNAASAHDAEADVRGRSFAAPPLRRPPPGGVLGDVDTDDDTGGARGV